MDRKVTLVIIVQNANDHQTYRIPLEAFYSSSIEQVLQIVEKVPQLNVGTQRVIKWGLEEATNYTRKEAEYVTLQQLIEHIKYHPTHLKLKLIIQ